MTTTVKLVDLAKTIRSKNAGNYFLTFEIIFDSFETYRKVKETGVINKDLIARIYRMPVEKVTHFTEYDPGNAIKVTIRRPIVSGDMGESDVYGCQQYAPLFDIEIPWDEKVCLERSRKDSTPE